MQDSNPRLRLRRPEGYPDYPNPLSNDAEKAIIQGYCISLSAYLERSPSSASISLSMSSLSCLLDFLALVVPSDTPNQHEQILFLPGTSNPLELPNFCNVLSCSLSSSHSFRYAHEIQMEPGAYPTR